MDAKGTARRSRSAEFKAEAVAACRDPEVSVAAVAMARGVNANLLRRWLTEAGCGRGKPMKTPSAMPVEAPSGFIPVALGVRPTQAPATDIRIELRRGATLVSVMWPSSAAGECAAWLRDWLR